MSTKRTFARLALCWRSHRPSSDGLYPFDEPKFTRQSRQGPITTHTNQRAPSGDECTCTFCAAAVAMSGQCVVIGRSADGEDGNHEPEGSRRQASHAARGESCGGSVRVSPSTHERERPRGVILHAASGAAARSASAAGRSASCTLRARRPRGRGARHRGRAAAPCGRRPPAPRPRRARAPCAPCSSLVVSRKLRPPRLLAPRARGGAAGYDRVALRP